MATIILCAYNIAVADGDTSASCPNRLSPGFRTYLPDCRAYELVSPAYKSGFQVGVTGVSESGEQVLAESFGNFSNTEDSGPFGQAYEFVRSGTNWDSLPLDAPFSEFSLYLLTTVSPDFRHSLWLAHIPAEPLLEGVYSGPPTGPLTRVGPGEPPSVVGSALEFRGASEDLSHALYIDHSRGGGGEPSHLWPGDTTAVGRLPSLYEYTGTGNFEPRLVGVGDAGLPQSIGAAHLISNCGTSLGSVPQGEAYNAVSATGATVFFTSWASSSCGAFGPPVNEVYARLEASRTVPISEPDFSDCEECEASQKADAQFAGASLDGSKIFFMTEQHLLPAATGTGPYLYEYDFNGPAGKRVTLISSGDSAGARVQGTARVSEDGSHVYFVAQGVLTGPNVEGRTPIAGAPNLYVWTKECLEGESTCANPMGHTSLVATLSATDNGDWQPQDIRPVQATPDGRFLVFQSIADLTSDQEGRQEAGQVFEYDAQTNMLVRVSRGQGGYNEDGNSSKYPATILRQGYGRQDPVGRFSRLAISADGSRVVFSSENALTPQALSGFGNVYEYHKGRVDLISDGHDPASKLPFAGVELIGIDASGLDVFFVTSERLVPQDTDAQTDVYDARIDGGSPPSTVRAPCAGDSCQGAASSLSSPPVTAPVVGEAPLPVTGAGASTQKAKPNRKTKVKPRPKKRKHVKKTARLGGRRSKGVGR